MPAYVNAATTGSSAGLTTLNGKVPASLVDGNILISHCSIKNNETITVTGTGWQKLFQVNSTAGFTDCLAWCVVSGTPPSCTFTWTSSVACRTITYQYSGVERYPFGASLSNTGSAATHSNTGITTTRDNSLVIYMDGCAANTAMATPAGWTENEDTGSSTALIRGTVGSKTVTTRGTASGSISVTGGAAAWVMWQIELLAPLTFVPKGKAINQALKRSNI